MARLPRNRTSCRPGGILPNRRRHNALRLGEVEFDRERVGGRMSGEGVRPPISLIGTKETAS